jgi:hypothetical protein
MSSKFQMVVTHLPIYSEAITQRLTTECPETADGNWKLVAQSAHHVPSWGNRLPTITVITTYELIDDKPG